MIRRFFIKLIEITKKKGVTISIHAKLSNMTGWILARAKDLVTITAFVRGRNVCVII